MRLAKSGVRHRQDGRDDGPAAARGDAGDLLEWEMSLR